MTICIFYTCCFKLVGIDPKKSHKKTRKWEKTPVPSTKMSVFFEFVCWDLQLIDDVAQLQPKTWNFLVFRTFRRFKRNCYLMFDPILAKQNITTHSEDVCSDFYSCVGPWRWLFMKRNVWTFLFERNLADFFATKKLGVQLSPAVIVSSSLLLRVSGVSHGLQQPWHCVAEVTWNQNCSKVQILFGSKMQVFFTIWEKFGQTIGNQDWSPCNVIFGALFLCEDCTWCESIFQE